MTVRAVAGLHTVDKAVTVNIRNVEERGEVTLSTVQPQEGTQLSAELVDDDGPSGITWQWYRTSSPGSTGAAIANADSDTYMPVGDDVGFHLRVVATYDDSHGTGKTAVAVSANRALAVNPDNVRPMFDPNGDYTRTIRENLPAGRNLGAPVRATDANSADRLTYSIPISDLFEIVDSTGQLRTKVPLDHEDRASHTVTVTATDPGGLTDTVTVTITVEDVDETPVISGPTAVNIAENGDTSVATYTATDPDEEGIEWVLTGTDSGAFTLSGGALAFKEIPDHEEKNRYRVTVEVREQGGGTSVGRLSVTVSITNIDEPGMVEVPVSEPRVGQRLTATVSDQDGGVGSIEWKWERRPSGGNWTPIPAATSRTYTPTRADNGHDLRVTAIYRDGHGSGKTETYQFARPVALRPYFDSDRATLSIQENTPADRNVGSRFTARHPDNVALTYTLRGADGIYFDIDETNGQLKTSGTPLDYETLSDHQAEVQITVTAPDNETGAITVTVTVTDECRTAGEPPCAPGRPSVSSTSDTSLRVSWSTPSSPSGTTITAYDLQYRVSGTSGSWISGSVPGTDRSHIIENLTMGTPYEVQVRAQNDIVGYGEWSQPGTGTPGYVPPPPPPPPVVPPGGISGGGTPPTTVNEECTVELGVATGTVARSGSWADDCESSVSGRGYARYYTFTLSEDTEVTIDLTSSVDTYLFLRSGSATSGTALHSNDDIESGNTNSRIVATLAAGTWTIEATTYSTNATGSFSLSVSGGGGAGSTEATGCIPATLTLPASGISGSWADDCESEVPGRGYARYYTFTLPEEAEVAIDLTSSVDTYLYLRSGSITSGTALHSNDDIESGNTNSRITATLAAGTWTIEATTYSTNATGSFSLSVSGGGGAGSTEATGCIPATLTLPASGISGSWADDCESEVPGRGYARYYTFTLPEEAEVAIDLTSSVDTYLYLRHGSITSGTALHSNDDIESGNTNSRIVATLAAGTWTIEATTYSPNTTGAFSLNVSGGGGSGSTEATGCIPATLTLPASGISGSWADDCESEVPGRGYARYYTFTLSESAGVTINLTSEVDTYLYLRSGSATSGTAQHSNDDIEGSNRNSRIVETLAAGSWTIEATTYNEDTTGSFTLSVSTGDASSSSGGNGATPSSVVKKAHGPVR